MVDATLSFTTLVPTSDRRTIQLIGRDKRHRLVIRWTCCLVTRLQSIHIEKKHWIVVLRIYHSTIQHMILRLAQQCSHVPMTVPLLTLRLSSCFGRTLNPSATTLARVHNAVRLRVTALLRLLYPNLRCFLFFATHAQLLVIVSPSDEVRLIPASLE